MLNVRPAGLTDAAQIKMVASFDEAGFLWRQNILAGRRQLALHAPEVMLLRVKDARCESQGSEIGGHWLLVFKFCSYALKSASRHISESAARSELPKVGTNTWDTHKSV